MSQYHKASYSDDAGKLVIVRSQIAYFLQEW